MDEHSRDPPNHFFTLRLWPAENGEEETIWRGRIQETASGEVRYFQGWEALVEVLLRLMEEDGQYPIPNKIAFKRQGEDR